MYAGSEHKTKVTISDIKEYHTENTVHFSVKMAPEEIKKVNEQGVEKALKMTSSVSETNMVLFDSEGRIRKYKSAVEIVEEFAGVRMKYYVHRKNYLIDKLTLERDLLSNRARFIKMIIEKKLHINNRKKMDVVKDLTKFKFQKFGDQKPPRTGFEYLLIMQIASLTKERKEELERLAKEKAAELDKIKRTSPSQMWVTDLDALEKAITDLYAAEAAERGNESAGKGKKRKAAAPARGKRTKPDGKEGDEKEGGDADDNAGNAADDLGDSPAGDITRWTAGHLAALVDGGAKRRRRK